MTIDEELSLLEDSVRKLKIEYDIYFGGGSKKPPIETEYRVQSFIKKYGDSQKLSFSQRFRYNSTVQRYALYNGLWQQKLRIRDEGYRRPADAALGISGMRTSEEREAAEALAAKRSAHDSVGDSFVANFFDVDAEAEQVNSLYNAIMDAKKKTGEWAPGGDVAMFKNFVKKKTEQIQREYHCLEVEYSVKTEDGQVRLKVKPKK